MKQTVALIGIMALVVIARPAAAQPVARAAQQCTAPGCELATAVVLQARATGRAVLTAEAPPTNTPAPTATPWPTWTPTPLPTATEAPTSTPAPTITSTPTPAASSTAAPTITTIPSISKEIPKRSSTVGDDLLVIAGGALILIALGLMAIRYFKFRERIDQVNQDGRRRDL